ncbi:hypothetical protein M1D34_28705 (plasmid) [Ensifer sp. D2-11]
MISNFGRASIVNWLSSEPSLWTLAERDHAGFFDTEGARAIGVKGSEQEAHLLAVTPLESAPAVAPI